MSEWKEIKLKHLTIKIGSGATPKGGQESYYDSGISLIRSQNVLDFEFSTNGLAFIDAEQARRLGNVVIEEEDVLLNITGDSVARVCKVPSHILPARVNQHVAIVRADSQKVDSDFLLYFLLNPAFKMHLLRLASDGGTRNALTKSDIENLLILVPSVEEQKDIANVLSCLDRKIENLRRQNETLEAIAQTLFKHWFVDFEFPNEDGKPYKSSGGEVKRSKLGEIPSDWHVGTLDDIGENIRDGISEGEIHPNMSYIALEHMPRKRIALDSWETADDIASNKFRFTKGNILFGKLRPYFHKVGVAFISGICSTDILVLDSKRKEMFGILLMILSSDEFIRYVSSAAEGTRMPRTSWQYMKEYCICIPSDEIVLAFNNFVNASINKIENNIFQIQTLTKTRETLLPQLMSGKLRVSE